MQKKQTLARGLFCIVVTFIVWVTILSRDSVYGQTFGFNPFNTFLLLWQDIRNGSIGNYFGNVLLFIPYGIMFPLTDFWEQKWYRTVLVGLCFSCAIEAVQLMTARGCFDPDDIMLNVVGTAIGYGIYSIAFHIFNES